MLIRIIGYDDPLFLQTLRSLRHDVYHLPQYLFIESRRTGAIPEAFLIVDGEKIFFLPYLVRKCDDIFFFHSAAQEYLDIASPYGYAGVLLSTAACEVPGFADFALSELKRVLKNKGVCSAFIRLHPILNQNFDALLKPSTLTTSGKTVSIDLKLSESRLWAHTRKGHQSTINKCKRIGLTARMVPFERHIDEFIEIYEETMSRVGADESYYFGHDYFAELSMLKEAIYLCIVELEDQIVCASLFFECGGIVQAHLGGTRTSFLSYSPFNLLLHYVRLWAKERGNEFLHLGGGVGGHEDSLYAFKTGFSKQRHEFLTLRLITDEYKYHHLVDLRAKAINALPGELLESNFFPAYRCPNEMAPEQKTVF